MSAATGTAEDSDSISARRRETKGRILHLSAVHRALDPRILRKEAASAARAGYQTFVAAPHPRQEAMDGVQIVPLLRGSAWLRPAVHRRAMRAARSLRPDVVHFHDPELIPACYLLKRRTGLRLIYDMHEDYGSRRGVQGRLLRGLERWCFRWVDHVVVAEDAYAEILRDARAACTPVLNYFLPPAGRNAPSSGTGGPFTLLYAGVQGYGRGLGTLLEIARRIRQRELGWKIRLVGICHRAGERRRAEAAVKRDGTEEVIDFVGWDRYVPWEELIDHYAGADAGLALYSPHPNYARSIPTKFYEYLHFGLPVLCADHGLMPGFVRRHGCGTAVRYDDADGIMSVLERWQSDAGLRAELSRNASSAAGHFHWRLMEERLLGVYEQVLKRRAG